MLRSIVCALLSFLYGAAISIGSMLFAVFFRDMGLLPVGYAIILVVFCGGGLGFVGWIKQRMGDPLVNVACSLASLAIITVVTKEGSVQSGDLKLDKISQVLKMVLTGVSASMAVSFLIFPISARKRLRSDLVDVMDTLAVLLAEITESFLSGGEEELQSSSFMNTVARHEKAYGQLDTVVREAKLEHYFSGTEGEYRLEKKLVRWVQNITQNLGGLRSAAALKFQLLNQLPKVQESSGPSFNAYDTFPTSSFSPEDAATDDETQSEISELQTVQHDGASETLYMAADIFEVFISHLGPSMV